MLSFFLLLQFLPGPVNGLLIDGKVLVYGSADSRIKKPEYVLFTHARRDVVWAGASLVKAGVPAIVPEAERELFTNPQAFWEHYETARFHDYSQVNTKVLRNPLPVSKGVRGGDTLDLDGVHADVIDTPGYTPGAVSYIFEIDGKKVACTGDLIYGDAQLFDISSLQDAIPESKTRGYHGYAARAGELIASLRKIKTLNPDIIVPARGPIIKNPSAAIDKLITRLQALMASHFSTDALLWYWGAGSLRIRSGKVLDGHPVDSMPMAEQRPLPAWALAVGNSRVLLSQSGDAFVVDAGYKGLQPKLNELTASGQVKNVEGIWITHYHDDHTDYAQETANRYHCPIYFDQHLQDVLEHPSAYRLPCLTPNPITSGRPQKDGAHMRWHEFQFTFFNFPGQTLYHDGLLVEKDGAESLFFVGDSFTPSGIDDYCLQNRDIVRENQGYLYCLRVLDKQAPDVWLINQHVDPTFRFSPEQRIRMRRELLKRIAILKELTPWPDPNYAIDESWAAIHPYGANVSKGGQLVLSLQITNHAGTPQTYRVNWNIPEGWKLTKSQKAITIASHQEGIVQAEVQANTPGLAVITADIDFPAQNLHEWTEALIRVNSF